MTKAIERMELAGSLAAELEKADKVIAVIMAHFSKSPADRLRLIADLEARGIGDHEKTRAALIQEVLYG